MNETALVKLILHYLKMQQIFAWRNNSGAVMMGGNRYVKFGINGMADVIGIYGERFLAIEAKVGKGKQSEDQIKFQQNVESNGGIYILAYSLDDVIEGLKSHHQQNINPQ